MSRIEDDTFEQVKLELYKQKEDKKKVMLKAKLLELEAMNKEIVKLTDKYDLLEDELDDLIDMNIEDIDLTELNYNSYISISGILPIANPYTCENKYLTTNSNGTISWSE